MVIERIIVGILLFLSIKTYAQRSNIQLESILMAHKIGTDTSLKKIILTNEQFLKEYTDGGGELIGYYKSKNIERILMKIYVSNGIETINYYFKNENLFFVLETFSTFKWDEKQEKFNRDETTNSYDNRYCIKNDELVCQTMTKSNRYGNVKDLLSSVKQDSRDNLDLLKPHLK
ncbi:MAG: hypothetical protein V4565_13580 [Bacteroidota bacterium]